ncbi:MULTISPECIES: hypothetical protein [Dehalococcoides]|uniref:Uncharacterized protein n=1 Tax=Dehalococcoides mccartyi TaxID=61435 RepID=A0A0V8M421_9CHLR|nr:MULTISPECIES: hypothetical protein [Dehalococcoides]KSV18504.1 hypothetical protein DA01_03470 [Dehalococcoides mccartyi]QYY58592.1 hypothetical protein CWV2_000523 [Dehalococcoides mccartyi]BAQ34023.1 hypothetical protein UCH007_00650 [Dehalococcoides sp. UCH007]
MIDIGLIITLVVFAVLFIGAILARGSWLLLSACGFLLMSLLPNEAIPQFAKIGIAVGMAWCFVWAMMILIRGEDNA